MYCWEFCRSSRVTERMNGSNDYYEALGFEDDHLATQTVWYRILNCGFRIPAGSGTDIMANFASVRGPIGMNRVYVRLRGPLTRRGFYQGLKAGRTFVTNGPLLGFTLGGVSVGDKLTLSAGSRRITARVTLRSMVPVERLEIIRNGEIAGSIPLTGDSTTVTATVPLMVDRSGWYLVRAWSHGARAPVLDLHPMATTSPIYVTVGGQPVRSPEDAAYFLAWMDRLEQAARANSGYNTDQERDHILGLIDAARQEFRRRQEP